jgi:exodeoxyribonuclease VII large subunit
LIPCEAIFGSLCKLLKLSRKGAEKKFDVRCDGDSPGTKKREWKLEQYSLQLIPERQIYTVSELNASIRATLEGEFRDVRVAGEISGVRLATSGHCYFILKEQDSTVKCVCYRSAYRYLKCKPRDGIAVLVRGQVGVFEARGEYQLQVESLEPQGHGALQLAFEDLKKKLSLEGLFDASRKRKLPVFPRRIGIVTSPRGAVISDILHVLERRFPGLHIRVFPALVQGDGSIEDVCRGIEYFNRSGWAEVLIVARGGGSLEDLWTFNTEAVARAIAGSATPVISAVGHETDVTIADFVADLRAPTPSAAAEVLCQTRQEILERIRAWEQKLTQSARYRLATATTDWRRQGIERVTSLLNRFIGRQLQNTDEKEYRLRERARAAIEKCERRRRSLEERLRQFDLRPKLERGRNRLDAAQATALRIMGIRIAKRRERLESCAAGLAQLSPTRILERGYALVSNEDGRLLKDAADAPAGSEIRVRLATGRLEAQVTASIAGLLAADEHR